MWFTSSSKTKEVHKVTARLINVSFSMQSSYPEQAGIGEKRVENRIPRMMPVAVFLNDDSDTSIFVGFTRDLSLEGVGLLTTREIPTGDLVIIVGNPEERFALRARCLQSRRLSFGCYQSGLQITEVLREAKYQPLLNYVKTLEAIEPGKPDATQPQTLSYR